MLHGGILCVESALHYAVPPSSMLVSPSCVLLLAFAPLPSTSGSEGAPVETEVVMHPYHQISTGIVAEDDSNSSRSSSSSRMNTEIKSLITWAQGMSVSKSMLKILLHGLEEGLGAGAEVRGLPGGNENIKFLSLACFSMTFNIP